MNTEIITLEDLDLTCRQYNCLKRAGINYKRDLEAMTESDLLKVRNLGYNGLKEVKSKVSLKQE